MFYRWRNWHLGVEYFVQDYRANKCQSWNSVFKACVLHYYAIPYIFTRTIRIRYYNFHLVEEVVGLEKLGRLARGTLLMWKIWDLDPDTVITEAMLCNASPPTVVLCTIILLGTLLISSSCSSLLYFGSLLYFILILFIPWHLGFQSGLLSWINLISWVVLVLKKKTFLFL